MKFVSAIAAGAARFGLVQGGRALMASDAHLAECPGLKAAIATGLPAAAARLQHDGITCDPAALRYLPVIPDPAQIYCVGLNYRRHRDETRQNDDRVYPADPVIFGRFATTLAAHDEDLPKPLNSDVVDYEGELAVIIGAPCHRIAEAEAERHIAGYSCFNDISMRDWQMRAEQWTPGKNFAQSGPFGPWLVTPDEVGPLDDLWLRTYLDGVEMQAAPFRDLIHGVAKCISYVSGFARLMPGDVIACGTPGGVGFTRKPPELLEPGRRVAVQIDRIGRLENAIVAA